VGLCNIVIAEGWDQQKFASQREFNIVEKFSRKDDSHVLRHFEIFGMHRMEVCG
jgi:hypothetical protein